MPIAPRYTWGQSKWPIYFWRSVGIVILVFFLATDTQKQPVTFTADLPFEVVQQMEEAGQACRGARDSGRSSCGVEVWKACHVANQSVENLDKVPAKRVTIVKYLCDHAVVADAAELGIALASRYGDEYYRGGWFETVKTDEGESSFLLFKDLVDSGYIPPPGYFVLSGNTRQKLGALRSSIRYFFRPYRGYGAAVPPKLQAAGILPSQDLGAIRINFWKEPSDAIYSNRITELNCTSARIAVRENRLGWDELLDYCYESADNCEEKTGSFRTSCALAKGAAEFESMWQRLPEVCAVSEGNGEQLTNAEKTSNIEEPAGDACYQVALAICKYRNVSPDDQWVEQLISMRDFACAAAARTPDLLYVKIDARVPSHKGPLPNRLILLDH